MCENWFCGSGIVKISVLSELFYGITDNFSFFSADILVTETFDAGLFGEGILPTLCHAWSKLLNQDEGIMVLLFPTTCIVYCFGDNNTMN